MTEPLSLSIKDIIEIVIAAITTLGTIGAAFWRFNTWINRTLNSLQVLQGDASQIAEQQKKFSRHINVLQNSISEMRKEMKDHDKDIARVEGAFTAAQGNVKDMAKDVQNATASIDAMWRTIHSAFPDRIPMRTIDKP